MLLVSLEKLVVIDVVYILSSSFVEIVHVELTYKGSQIVVLEVSGEDFLAEFRRLFDNKGGAFGIPVNDIREFSFVEDVIGFANKGRDGVLSVSLGFGFVFTVQFGSHF